MPVQRAEDVLNRHTGEYLAKVVPDDFLCTYSVAPVTYEFEGCEHGIPRTMAVVWQVNVFLEPVDSDRPEKRIRYNAVVPFDHLDGGDTDALTSVLDTLWQEITFAQMLGTIDPELEAAAREPEE